MKERKLKFYIAIGSWYKSKLIFNKIYVSKKEAEHELKKYGWKIVKVEKIVKF